MAVWGWADQFTAGIGDVFAAKTLSAFRDVAGYFDVSIQSTFRYPNTHPGFTRNAVGKILGSIGCRAKLGAVILTGRTAKNCVCAGDFAKTGNDFFR